jgi:HPt (histidine-containing phosphotransfer) domain-containing protein
VAGVLAKPFDPLRLPDDLDRLLVEAALRTRLARLRQLGGPRLVGALIDLFVGGVSERLAAARVAAAAGDRAGVAAVAHALKASAGNLGADAVRRTAEALEHAAGEPAEALPPLLDTLDQACARARECLEALRERDG